MAHGLHRLALLLAPALAFAAIPGAAARPLAAADKSIFVGALDPSGSPVRDLRLDELRLREDGVDREIVSVRAATQPLQIALLADSTQAADSVIRDVRSSLGAFITQVHAGSADAAISLIEFGQAAVTVVPFVTDDAALSAGINRLVGRPAAASVLLEAIIEASDRLAKRPSTRRAIVGLNIEPSNEQSREEPKKVNDSLRQSGAQLWSVSLQKGDLRNPNRDVVLNAVAKNTGGSRELVNSPPALEAVMKRFADALASQYEVTYRRPGASAAVVQVGVTRQGVALHASGFAPR
jgi:hypothetical protein